MANEIVTANDAAAEKLPIDNEHVIDSIIVYFLFGRRPFSLIKYCAIFLKDKGYFCPIASNNQFGIGNGVLCFWVASEFESRYTNSLEADNANETNLANEADVEVILTNDAILDEAILIDDAANEVIVASNSAGSIEI